VRCSSSGSAAGTGDAARAKHNRVHLHLDPVGGIAGDMFVAALLDLNPERAPLVRDAVRAAGLDPAIETDCAPHHDGVLVGRRSATAFIFE